MMMKRHCKALTFMLGAATSTQQVIKRSLDFNFTAAFEVTWKKMVVSVDNCLGALSLESSICIRYDVNIDTSCICVETYNAL